MAEKEKLIEVKDLKVSFGSGRNEFVAVHDIKIGRASCRERV